MIRVIMADDHPIVREGLRRVLERSDGISVVAETDRGDALVALVQETRPTVVVLDITMPGPGFLELIPALRAAAPGVQILVLSGHPEGEYAVHALRAGAAGYLSKLQAPEQLVAAVRRLAEGRRYVSDTLAEQLAAAAGEAAAEVRHNQLSPREFAVLRLIAAGRSLKQIGAELGVHPKTVSTFRSRVLQKLALKSNAELVRYALQHQLVDETGAGPVS